MSIANLSNSRATADFASDLNADSARLIEPIIQTVQDLVSPVWPLRDYVAVNPYGGLADRKFLVARQSLRDISDCEMLMPLDYYQQRFQQGKFGLTELKAAIDEMVADGIPGAETLNANAIYKILQAVDVTAQAGESSPRRLHTLAQSYDRFNGTDWNETITEEISKYCSAHYDEGQATWTSPAQELPLYQAWRSAAQIDRRIELLGICKFRKFVGKLPFTPELAVLKLIDELGVPQRLWADYLLCLALTMPGWSAWTKYKTVESAKQGLDHPDFAALLAIRLAYEVALSRQFDFHVAFETTPFTPANRPPTQEALLGMTLLRANEIGIRTRILDGISQGATQHATSAPTRSGGKLAQMVFCIDVRSERIRRQLEATSSEIETFGFAGFFGLPFEYVGLGDHSGTNQLPVLIDAKFKVYEEVRLSDGSDPGTAKHRRSRIRGLRSLWKSFQTSAVSCFAYVETTGLLASGKLLSRVVGKPSKSTRFDGLAAANQHQLGPSLRDLHRQGVSNSDQVEMAESMLRGIGLTEAFAPLVVLCGHAAKTENNPLQAGLDCGACAGHSGEANARFGAMLLNQPYIRSKLAERGIDIPSDVHFVAGLHNTTTDEIGFFDVDLLPTSHAGYLSELQGRAATASDLARQERLESLPGKGTDSLVRRSVDWSEVRPEWGLTGNAAFIVGPRKLTQSINLRGESFLHSYDHRNDPEGRVLEQIMTAPMVVANWINMQYYASTVDQKHFGSGNKTVHNVVGNFGILSGNGGDLTTGLPWQSVHAGESYQHDPVRLLSVIEAPRNAIERILAAHQNVRDLVVNGWVNLVAVEQGEFYRYGENSEWQPLHMGSSAASANPLRLQPN